MPDKKTIVILFFALVSYTGFGQTFVMHAIDFRDSINSKLVTNNTDNLATLLIDGYLSGSLTGYKFNIGEQVLKRAPLESSVIPRPWNANDTYFPNDRVTYKGKFFLLTKEVENAIPTISEAWKEITLLGMPISTRYYFPTLKDTLSKQDFLRAMVSAAPTLFSPWYKEFTYYASDVIEFNGRNYEAITDNEGKSPDVNPNDWHPTHQGEMTLFSMQDLGAVAVLNELQKNHTETAHKPVMLSIMVYDYQIDFYRLLGLHFYFEDVIHYLNQLKFQPLLYSSETGYLGDSHIVSDYTRKIILLNKLKDGLKSKKIKPGKKMIVHKTSYDEFLAEPTFVELPVRWNFFLNSSGDFVLTNASTVGFRNVSNAIAVIPVAKLKSILPAPAPRLFTYSEALTDALLHLNSYDTLHYDTLDPVKIIPVKPLAPPQNFFWLETYRAGIDSADRKTQEKFSSIWNVLQKAIYKNQLPVENPVRTFFPCRLGISGSLEFYRHTLTFKPDYKFNDPDQLEVDSLEVPVRFIDCSVTYKKTTNRNLNTSFTPFEISFKFITQSGTEDQPVSYTLQWNDVKNTLQQYLPQAAKFITEVEQVKLNFLESEVVYGVISER